jgi:hypothetical protein
MGTDVDLAEAANLYQKSAHDPNLMSVRDLAMFTQYGIGVDSDLEESLSCYEMREESDHIATSVNNAKRCRLPERVDDFYSSEVRFPFPKVNHALSETLQEFLLTRPPLSSTRTSEYLTSPLASDTRGLVFVASGGSSRIFLRRDPSTGGVIAVKHISSESYVEHQFLQEVKVMALLNHPSIVRIVGWSPPHEPDHIAEIQTEYAEYRSLASLMTSLENGCRVPFWNATGHCIIICGIVLGMRYVHSRGVLHRDLKPSNILINHHGHTLIGDFGSSCLERDVSSELSEGATVRYAAPEQFEETIVTAKVDVFSFGLILYEILTEQPVFEPSCRVFDVIGRHRNGTMPPLPEAYPAFVGELLSQCWLKNPADRPSFSDIFALIESRQFKVLAGTDDAAVFAYVFAVLGWEAHHRS